MIGPFGFHPNKTMYSRAMGLARPLIQLGHQVTMLMPPWHTPDEADKTWQQDGVTVRYVPLRGGTLGITRQLVREALAAQPDVVHCFKPKAYSGLAAWWLWQTQRQAVRLVMDTDDWEGAGGWNDKNSYSPLQKRFFAWQEQWGMRHCHTLTVASRALETIAQSMGIAAEKILYLPNGAGFVGVHPLFGAGWQAARTAVFAEYGLGKRPLLLLYSRLFEFDVGRLVAVLSQVKTAVPDLQILSVGSGLFDDDAVQLRHQFAAANLLTSVVDAGWVAPEKLPDLLTAADVGLYLMDDTLLNRTKCPVKLADMVRAGVPVVGEAVGQVAEYVQNGRSGALHSSGDVAGVAQSVSHILQSAETRRAYGLAAQAHARQFAWEQSANRLLAAYQA